MGVTVDRWDLVDGTILESVEGHRVMIDGMAGPYLKLVDDGGRVPLPAPGWVAIGPSDLVGHVNAGRWVVAGA